MSISIVLKITPLGWHRALCCVRDATGDFYMAHQERLSPDNHMMVYMSEKFLDRRRIPLSPKDMLAFRMCCSLADVAGVWEWINLSESMDTRDLRQVKCRGRKSA